MKRFLKTLLVVTMVLSLVMSLSVTAFAGGVEDGGPTVEETVQGWVDEGYPVVSRVYDSSAASYARLSTDQMGEYVSIFVNGYNIDMDTIKPVFYDDEGNVISGDVVAVETVTGGYYQGAYFRIKKLESDAWNIDNTGSVNTKYFKIKLESVCDKEIKYDGEFFNEKVQLFRRDVFYTSFDSIRETFTLYFSSDVKADTNIMPELALGYHYYDSETGLFPMNTVKELTATKMIKEVNKFTGQEETKAVFSLAGFDYNNAFENWTPQFKVTFKNSLTGEMETFDIYDDMDTHQCVGRTSLFPETSETAYVKGNRDVILYYPYWIGGVHKFTYTEKQHFLTKEEAEYFGNERFAYTDYSQGNGSLTKGDFKNRQYSFTFYISDIIEKPKGVPAVTVQHSGDDYILSWNKISGASGYKIYAVLAEDTAFVIEDTDKLTCTINKYMLSEFSEMGGENVQLKICAYVNKNGVTIEGDLSKEISLEQTEVEQPEIKQPEMKLKYTKKSLDAGKTLKLSVVNANGQKITYKSNKPSVATVNKTTGTVTALKKGTAKITATVAGKKFNCTITVKKSPKITYNKKTANNNKTISVKKGKTVKLVITGKVSSIKNKVTTSKKSVAKITSDSKKSYVTIKAVKKGTATVKVKINNVVTYKYKIKVK